MQRVDDRQADGVMEDDRDEASEERMGRWGMRRG